MHVCVKARSVSCKDQKIQLMGMTEVEATQFEESRGERGRGRRRGGVCDK